MNAASRYSQPDTLPDDYDIFRICYLWTTHPNYTLIAKVVGKDPIERRTYRKTAQILGITTSQALYYPQKSPGK